MSKMHYQSFVLLLRRLRSNTTVKGVDEFTDTLIALLKADNPRFDETRFRDELQKSD